MKNFPIYCIVILFSISGCINEDFNETFSNTEITPEYSLPVGFTEYFLNSFFTGPEALVPSTNDTNFYYNDLPYKDPYLNFTFRTNEQKPLDISNSDRLKKQIESITFHLFVTNSFPSDVTSKIYLLDGNDHRVDSVGPIIINGAPANALGQSIDSVTKIIDIPYSNVDVFKGSVYYDITSIIRTQKAGIDTLRFYSKNSIKINIGIRIKLRLTAND